MIGKREEVDQRAVRVEKDGIELLSTSHDPVPSPPSVILVAVVQHWHRAPMLRGWVNGVGSNGTRGEGESLG